MTTCHCDATDRQFDPGIARRDLKRFRKRGPDPATRQLVAAIRAASGAPGATLLDIGGGVGAIHHVLLEDGFAHAAQVDASSAYLAAAEDEAKRLGHDGRVTFRHGDFRALAPEVPAADVVTLDRVVCCDPDYAGMLGGAAGHARRLVALTYPRYRWDVRAAVVIFNGLRRLARHPFRAYVHPPAAMSAVLERAGLRLRWSGGTWIWAAQVFERADG